MPETVKIIGNWAFRGCTNLEVINIPDRVEGGFHKLYGVFGNCPALREIIITEEERENLFVYRDRDGHGSLMPARDIFEEAEDDDSGKSDKNCGPWYLNFKHKFQAEELKRIQEERRAKNKCPYCGGSFSGWFTIKCNQCGKIKDY